MNRCREHLHGDHVGLHRERHTRGPAPQGRHDPTPQVELDLPGQPSIRDRDPDVIDTCLGQGHRLLDGLSRIYLDDHHQQRKGVG